MPHTLASVRDTVEQLWPLAGAESWDASGLVAGDPEATIERILLAVDAVAATVDEAVDTGADLLIAHHPLLLRGVTTVAEDRYKGALLARLIREDVALYAAHTTADVVADGTSDVLAARLGLRDARPIAPAADGVTGIGRVGDLAQPTTLGQLARAVADLLPPTAGGVRAAGDYHQPATRVAVCGGAGDSLLGTPAVREADVYITADLRHHPASEAREQAVLGGGPALLDVSHWASEWLWLDTAAEKLREALPGVEVAVSELRTDPWDFAILQ
ncbi:Nif3-like dinuclear metal center hexameric protein [Leifsonia shinshuensis]|uniref:Nif3-like dinuclear metal center hexameric protein n=1 Tax=Leifsonia shinshuensis TaxID=150026 RepID=UPI002865B386|nr:Nif3-like dinuclear metal center hexameric protein [Leifsonia shinshuensis]MDR6970863.1 dinuclear metal center YbgI/SA1388 family protein [Leifsonia shinshuensis]